MSLARRRPASPGQAAPRGGSPGEGLWVGDARRGLQGRTGRKQPAVVLMGLLPRSPGWPQILGLLFRVTPKRLGCWMWWMSKADLSDRPWGVVPGTRSGAQRCVSGAGRASLSVCSFRGTQMSLCDMGVHPRQRMSMAVAQKGTDVGQWEPCFGLTQWPGPKKAPNFPQGSRKGR